MWPDRVLNRGPLAFESDELPTALCSRLTEIHVVMNLSVSIFYTLDDNGII